MSTAFLNTAIGGRSRPASQLRRRCPYLEGHLFLAADQRCSVLKRSHVTPR
jgi:hypothetical protein